MSKLIVIVFCVINALQSLIILVGNTFTVYVFWSRRHSLKRTGLLLINLAVIDLLVGAATFIEITQQISQKDGIEAIHYDNPISIFQVLCSCSSVFCLVAISLERVYAILWPLRHRAASTKAYMLSIIFVWLAGLAIALVYTFQMLQLLPTTYSTVIQDVALVSSLVIVVTAYMTIHTRMKLTVPSLEAHNRPSTEQNVKLSRTLFIVIALSLSLWLPTIVLYTIDDLCTYCNVPEVLLLISRVLHLSNSIVNPIVYSYRMPMFKEAMKRCLNKCSFIKRPKNEESTQTGTFDTPL
ncbi:adenosine receptor A2a-like [Oculina patagonica]